MSEPVRIDSHVHIYQSAEEGIAAKEGYEIWEYGRQEEVAISDVPGTVDDLLRSMAKAAMDKVVIVNLYVADERRSNLRKALPPNPGPSERERAEREIEARVREELMVFNRGACEVARDRPAIFPFVCADVLLFTGEGNAAHVRDLAESYDNAYFDCCEVIEWTRSENGPSERELARLIQDIGTDRVMMGSDFPWYDLDQTVDRVMSLPLLSMEEKEGIIGASRV